MSNYAWLCDYTSCSIDTYGIWIQTDDYDGSENFFLEKKERLNQLSDVEQKKLNELHKSIYQFMKSWHERVFIKNLPVKLFKKPELDIDYSNMPKENETLFKITDGYLVINKQFYHVISQFNLGKTHFSQVYIYDIETKEQLSDIPYYFMNIAETREFLDSDKSKGIKASDYTPHKPLRFIWATKDDDIILSCADGELAVDVWSERYLDESLFFSDRLVQALFEAGFTQKELGLVRCRID